MSDYVLYFKNDQGGSLLASKTVRLSYNIEETVEKKGSCLIATAAYGSKLSPQVQFLSEVRDNELLRMSSGITFMAAFNQFYYSFSPTVADWERQNPVFKELVKATITPMLSTLSILKYVNIESDQEMLGYGIDIILLNLGMYVALPVFVVKLKNHLKYYNI